MPSEMRRHVRAMSVICAWCDTVLVRGGPEVSHGLCEGCADAFSRSIDALPRRPFIG